MSSQVTIREVVNPQLGRLFFGLLCNAVGNGLTLPILVVYLNQVRGISVTQSALVLSFEAVLGLAVAPVVGWAIDHFGPRRILILGLVVWAVSTAMWSLVSEFRTALLVGAFSSAGGAAAWPAQSTLVARVVPEQLRQRAFGLQFMILNLGLGLGGLIGGVMVDLKRPETFTHLYLINASVFIVYLVIVVAMRSVGGPIKHEDEEAKRGSYRDLLADRKLLSVLAVAIMLITFGYGSLDAGLPTFVTTIGHLEVGQLGPIWAVNTSVIVVGQWFILKATEGRSRIRLVGVTGLLWAVSWLIFGASGLVPSALTFATAAFSMAIFAVGEMVWSPLLPALTNELAPEHLRGRYNATVSISWVIAGTVGPAMAGLLLGSDLGFAWIGLTAAGCLLAGLFAQLLYSRLTPAQDGRTADVLAV